MKHALLRPFLATAALCLLATLSASPAGAVRLKDLADLEGVRPNQLIGYGLVVGLAGSGDSDKARFTSQSLASMLGRLDVEVDQQQLKVRNVAAVMVTAELPPFATAGTAIDVTLSSIGDAESLGGGTLVMTPLRGADGEIYAVAQGAVVLGGFSASGEGARAQKNHATVGRVPEGALIERSLQVELDRQELRYTLRQADFTTAARAAEAIDQALGERCTEALDASHLRIRVPEARRKNLIPLIAAVEAAEIRPDTPARIVVSERTGTLVMGENVRLSKVAVAHGNLLVTIHEAAPSPPTVMPGRPGLPPLPRLPAAARTALIATETPGTMGLAEGSNVGELARALNALGATPRDLIAILQAMRAAGALHAELEVL